MSIILIPFPNAAPVNITDWEENIDITQFNSYGINSVVDYNFDSNTLKQGVRIMIGGAVYLVSTDEAITGTPSNYVKVTLSGSTAAAAYVANLSGVSWNSAYNFYADVSGNAYLFDEAKAVYDGIFSEAHTKVGSISYLNGIESQVMTGNMQWKKYYSSSSSPTEDTLYDNIGSWIPGLTDRLVCHGQARNDQAGGAGIKIQSIARATVSRIILYGISIGTNTIVSIVIDDGSGSIVASDITIMSNYDAIQ